MVFCNKKMVSVKFNTNSVTIPILIDGFLQYFKTISLFSANVSHNPYFNRWFSAILKNALKTKIKESHNPYFNRWFSAIS